MEKLLVVKGQLEGREFDLQGPTVSIGREEKRDITLPESLVSRNHAVLEKKDDGWYITDHGSANGTNVNGVRLTESSKLNNGDHIEIGNFTLQFVAPTVSLDDEADEKTVLLGDAPEPAVAPEAPSAPEPPIPAPPPPGPDAPAPAPPPPAPAPPVPAPPVPTGAGGDAPPVKVDSTIYISDDMPSSDFPTGEVPVETPTEEQAPPAEEKKKSKLGLIILLLVVFFFFMLIACGVVGYLIYTQMSALDLPGVEPVVRLVSATLQAALG